MGKKRLVPHEARLKIINQKDQLSVRFAYWQVKAAQLEDFAKLIHENYIQKLNSVIKYKHYIEVIYESCKSN